MLHTELTLPSQFVTISESATHGVFEVRGLFPGYGHTVGNALRRVILSSLPGAAIVSVKIEGVDHEFATLEGMREDILRFTLNLQQVRAELIGVDEATATISVTGPGVITAKDITGNSSVVIANPDLYLCELTGKTKLNVELNWKTGIGYVPKTMHHKDRVPVGTIVLDAIYTPTRKVSYEVENMRVGDRTDYNRLIISVDTDGSIAPRSAFESAVKIMIAQMRAMLNLVAEELSEPTSAELHNSGMVETVDSVMEIDNSTEDALKTRIDTLELSARTLNALSSANIRTLGGLVRKSAQDILNLEGIGPKGLDEVQVALNSFGLKLKED